MFRRVVKAKAPCTVGDDDDPNAVPFAKSPSVATTVAPSGTDSADLGTPAYFHGGNHESDDDSTPCSVQPSPKEGAVSSQGGGQKPSALASKKASSSSDDSASLGSNSDEEESKCLGGVSSPEQPPSPNRASMPMRRRSGIQSSPQEMFVGLKERFDAMEQLDTTPSRSVDGQMCRSDELEYIRLLTPAQFVTLLKAHNVPVESYGQGKARCLRDLWAEVIIRECNLERFQLQDGLWHLRRNVRILVLEIGAIVDGVDRFLLVKQESNDYGHVRDNLDARVTKKMFDDEDIPSAIIRCLLQTLGMEGVSVEDNFDIDGAEDITEVKDSTAFPGLSTMYTLHLVRLSVRDPHSPLMSAIGLPEGKDFTNVMMSSAVGVRKKRTWVWCSREVLDSANAANKGRETSPRKGRRCKTLSQLGE